MRISDWSSDVCSSDLGLLPDDHPLSAGAARSLVLKEADVVLLVGARLNWLLSHGKGKTWGAPGTQKFIQIDIEPREMDSNVEIAAPVVGDIGSCVAALLAGMGGNWRSEEHTSELQSLMRISYAVFCLKKKKTTKHV